MTSNILPIELRGKYSVVNKKFLHKLLKKHIHPQKYVTKALTSDEQNIHDLLVSMVNEQLNAGVDFVTRKKLQELNVASVKRRQEIFRELEDQLFNITTTKAGTVEELITGFYLEGAKQGYSNIHREIVFTKADEYSLFHVNQYTFDQIRNLSDDLTSQVKNEIWRGVGEGASIPTIQNRILEAGIEPLNVNGRVLSPVTRAEMIARTETARARNAGALQAYGNYGLEQGELITAGDASVCEDCLELEGSNPHSLEELSNIAPVHPNCRCAVAPYLGGDGYSSEAVDNPIVIDITTDNTEEELRASDVIGALMSVGGESSGTSIGFDINVDDEEIFLSGRLKGKIPASYQEWLPDKVAKFRKKTLHYDFEYSEFYDKNGKCIGVATSTSSKKHIYLFTEEAYKDIVTDAKKGINVFGIHNHPVGKNSVSSHGDIYTMVRLKENTHISTSGEYGSFLIRNKNVKQNSSNEVLEKINQDGEKWFGKIKKEIRDDPEYGLKLKENDNDYLKDRNKEKYNERFNNICDEFLRKYPTRAEQSLNKMFNKYGISVEYIPKAYK